MSQCMRCGKPLSSDEIGAHRKLINRGSTTFFCKVCLATELKVTPELIDRKIEEFKRAGCQLFV